MPRHDLLKRQPATFPFRLLWVNKKINWRQYQYIYVAPVDTSHLFSQTAWDKFNTKGLTEFQFKQGMKAINHDVHYIGNFMREEFIKALEKNSRRLHLTVVPDSFPSCLVLRLALVKLVPTKVFMNAGGIIANIFLPRAGVVASMASFGTVGFEGMLMEANGRVLMMFAEQDKDTVTLVDVDGLTWYSHAKKIIIEWSNDFSQIIKNPNSDFLTCKN